MTEAANTLYTGLIIVRLKTRIGAYLQCSLVWWIRKISKLTISCSARNLGFMFDEHLTFSDQITALSKSCYYHIREHRRIRPYLDFKTASTIATSIVHSKLDYCNSLYHNLPNCQLNRLQQIQNSVARAVVKAPKSTHITPILKSLHWIKVNERIEYKLISLTYKVLTTAQPSYIFTTLSLFNLLAVPAPRLLSLFLARQLSPPWKSQIVQRLREIDILTDKVSAVHTKHHGAFVLSYN